MEGGKGGLAGDAVKVGALVGVEVLVWNMGAMLQDSTTMLLPRMKGMSVSVRLRIFSTRCIFIERVNQIII